MKKYKIIFLSFLLSLFLTACDISASQLISDSVEFTKFSVVSLIGDIKETVGLERGEQKTSMADLLDEEAGADAEETEEGDAGDPEENGENGKKDAKGKDADNGAGDETGDEAGETAENTESAGDETAASKLDGITKQDLKNKVTVSDSFDCDKIYGFLKKSDIMLLSKSPDESDTESVIGYVKCLGATFDPGDIVRIKSFKSYAVGEYAAGEDAIANVITLTSFKVLKGDDLSKELFQFGVLSSGGDGDFVFPDSGMREIDVEELYDLSKEQCDIARNEIYARHGRKFKNEELQEYFNSKSWYEPKYEPDSFPESLLNQYEKKNAGMILQYEKKKGYQ